jgi:ring-1,2-phenylacetyl-CoA epoxidase subunit PaaD
MAMYNSDDILKILEDVKDPEIPVLTIVDLGIINGIEFRDEVVCVEITPTFVGCPAVDHIKTEIISALHQKGVKAEVHVNFSAPWTSDRITPHGRDALKAFGLGPPPKSDLIKDISILENTLCPQCGSLNTELKSLFGATLCRSIHYCLDCKEAYEQFKPL